MLSSSYSHPWDQSKWTDLMSGNGSLNYCTWGQVKFGYSLSNPATLGNNTSVLIRGLALFQGGTCADFHYFGPFKVA